MLLKYSLITVLSGDEALVGRIHAGGPAEHRRSVPLGYSSRATYAWGLIEDKLNEIKDTVNRFQKEMNAVDRPATDAEPFDGLKVV